MPMNFLSSPVFAAILANRQPSVSPLLENLVSYWKFDEASGTTDDSIGSNHLTASNNPVSTTGKVSGARNFVAASSQFLSVAPSGLSFGTGDFTISFWIKRVNNNSLQTILNWGPQSTGFQYLWIYTLNGNLSVQLGAGEGSFEEINTGVGLGTGSFVHIVLAFDRSGNLSVYKNDSLEYVHSITSQSSAIAPSGNFFVGDYRGLEVFPLDAALDELKVWHRLLDGDEVHLDYSNGAAGTPLL